MSQPNLFTTETTSDPDDPEGFRAASVSLTELLGASELIVKLIEVPPGNHSCPYHYEYVEEWLVVARGPVDVRTPEGTTRLVTGDVMHFPPGAGGAHRVTAPGDGEAPARLLMFSADADPSVAYYPDSDKLAVYTHSGEGEVFVRRGAPSSHLDYFDGETA